MQIKTRYGDLVTPDADNDLIVKFLRHYGEWAWDEASFISSIVSDGDKILDVGAYLGTFGLGVASLKKLSKICFVEANTNIVGFLRQNVAQNSAGETIVVEAMVKGNIIEPLSGHHSQDNSGSASFVGGHEGQVVLPLPVATATLAELRAEHGPFDLIKLDVEGLEFDILNSDAEYLSKGNTAMWLECNEDVRSIYLAELLLSWGLKVYYFAFPSFNPDNFQNDKEPIFSFAFEAGLLSASKIEPKLHPTLLMHGCILRSINNIEELKDVLWRTPRWGMREWHDASTSELAALAGRTIRGDRRESFLDMKRSSDKQNVALELKLYDLTLKSKKTEVLASQLFNDLQMERIEHANAKLIVERHANASVKPRVEIDQQAYPLEEEQSELPKPNSLAVEKLAPENNAGGFKRGGTRRILGRTLKILSERIGLKYNLGQPSISRDIRNALSKHFDADFYLKTYSDVLKAKVDPLEHFHTFGWREGRNPSPRFNTNFYLKRNVDVAIANINPLLHYAWEGHKEGREVDRTMSKWRQQLEAATPIRERSKAWNSELVGEKINELKLVGFLRESKGLNGCMISFSHDDYRDNCGGVQNLIGDEERSFIAANWSYLHVSPAKPLPMLADVTNASEFRVRLRLNGRSIGSLPFSQFSNALVEYNADIKNIECVVHHFLGFAPELISEFCRAAAIIKTFVWTHDYFTICPGFTLMRNDIEYCGAPRVTSQACAICCYGGERSSHLERISTFFRSVDVKVLAPSEVALRLWQKSFPLKNIESEVVPLAQLSAEVKTSLNPNLKQLGALKIAHLGGRVFHKGWPVFEELAFRFRDDARYKFYQLGSQGGDSLPPEIENIPVLVNANDRNAMVDALRENKIDVVLIWSPWPETFSYVVHEALAAGVFIIAKSGMGNVWPAVLLNAPSQGIGLESIAEVYEVFATDQLSKNIQVSSFGEHLLTLNSGTADIVLKQIDDRPKKTMSERAKVTSITRSVTKKKL